MIMQNDSQKKYSRRRYVIASGILLLCVLAGFVYKVITWQLKPDPVSEMKIRKAAAIKLHKDPNDITDDDFALFESVDISQKSIALSTSSLELLIIRMEDFSGIKYLEKFTNLQKLTLIDISPKLPKWMAILEKIGYKKSNRKITIDFRPLENLAGFKQLYIERTPIATLKSLRQLKNLEILSLSYTQVSDLGQITGMKSLKELVFFHTPVSNLKPVSNLVNLEVLDIRGTAVTNLEPLRNLSNLKNLFLSETKISNLEPLANMINLEILDLQVTLVSDLEPLKILTNLKSLYIKDCVNITDKQKEDLQKALPQLQINK